MTSDKFKGKFQGLHLPKEVIDKIFNKNTIKWYKLPVNELNLSVTLHTYLNKLTLRNK
jgi:hypothetical protein